MASVGPPDAARQRGPTLAVERGLLAAGAPRVIGMDEVGRGALAGPVCVGAVCVTRETPDPPPGLADSKELRPAQRETMAQALATWGVGWSLGWASAADVDRYGIIGALRQAGLRALSTLACEDATILLDGHHDWLSAPLTLAEAMDDDVPSLGALAVAQVVMRVKADASCASVAAASVHAKVARDQMMGRLAAEYPAYGWAENKGYGSAEHREVIARLGPTDQHRRTWHLFGPKSDAGR